MCKCCKTMRVKKIFLKLHYIVKKLIRKTGTLTYICAIWTTWNDSNQLSLSLKFWTLATWNNGVGGVYDLYSEPPPGGYFMAHKRPCRWFGCTVKVTCPVAWMETIFEMAVTTQCTDTINLFGRPPSLPLQLFPLHKLWAQIQPVFPLTASTKRAIILWHAHHRPVCTCVAWLHKNKKTKTLKKHIICSK